MVYHMSNILNKQQEIMTTAFGEASVAEARPVLQITGQYGLRDDVLVAALGGTGITQDSKFVISTGTGVNNVSAIVSNREATYRAGQGLLARFTALFTADTPNSKQFAGFITSESGFTFGYNGDEFGIAHSTGGSLELQELQITSSGTGNVDITVDGNIYTVTLTSGTVQHNAYEIAAYLGDNVPGYNASSTDDTVSILAQLPDLGVGAFTYNALASGSAATFTEIESGVIMQDVWTPKSEWNVNPNIDIDPSLGNVYQIQLQYLGFGGIRFFIENPETAAFELVHIIRYANTSTMPSVKNPIFRIGWAARNIGNTTNVVVQGASAAIFIEGDIVYDGRQKGSCHTAVNIGTTRTNILAIKNRLSFNDTANRADLLPRFLNVATDTTKTAVYEVIVDPIVAAGDSLNFQSQGSAELAEIAIDQAEITGGEVLACFNVKAQGSFSNDLENALTSILPGQIVAITAKVTSGSSADMDASITWQDDL